MKKRKSGWILLSVLLIGAALLLEGCNRSGKDQNRKSRGIDDEINGFLLNFDERDETSILVRNVKKGKYPTAITWHYEKDHSRLKAKEQVIRYSEDPEFIEELYYALSNTIVVGISTDQTEMPHFHIAFTLADGEECRYDFVQENTVRLSGQNYVIETDGTLWSTLTEEAGSAETEIEYLQSLPEETEGNSEAIAEGETE